MSHPSYQHNHHHYHGLNLGHHELELAVKQEASTFTTTTTTTTTTKEHIHSPPSLKINRDSHVIKKSHQHHLQQRSPVIIYTHSPKIIHTNPKDFRALVQKLTGMSKAKTSAASSMAREAQSRDEIGAPFVSNESPLLVQCHPGAGNKNNSTDEESSVVTDENCSSNSTTTGDANAIGHFNPCLESPFFDAPPASPNLPLFMDNSSGLLCCNGDPSIYDYMDFNVSYSHISY